MSFEDISKSLLEAVNSVLLGEVSISDLDSDLQSKAKSMLKKVKNGQKLVLNAKTGDLQIVSDKESDKDFLAVISEECDHDVEESCDDCEDEVEEDHIPGQDEEPFDEATKLQRGQVVMIELERKIMVGAVIMNVTPAGWVAWNYRGEEFISRIKDIKISPMKKEAIEALGITEALDKHLANDIHLTASSDGKFYKANVEPVWKNLARKIKSGKFDVSKTKPFAKRLGKAAVDFYKKEVQDDSIVYSKETQAAVGEELLDDAIRIAKEENQIFEGKVKDMDEAMKRGSFELGTKVRVRGSKPVGTITAKAKNLAGDKVQLVDFGAGKDKHLINVADLEEISEVTTVDAVQDELDSDASSIDASPEPNSAVGARRGVECPKQVDVLFDADFRDIASGTPGLGYRLMIQYPSGRTEFLPPAGLPPVKELSDLRVLCEILPEECREVCIASINQASVSPSDLPQYVGNGKQEQ